MLPPSALVEDSPILAHAGQSLARGIHARFSAGAIAFQRIRRHFLAMLPILDWFSRLMLVFAGALGSGGIAAAAASSHFVDDRVLGAVALIALTHAPAALAFGLVSPTSPLLRTGAISIAAGACLFSGILAARQLLGWTLMPGLAPASAIAAVAGWLLVASVGLFGRRSGRSGSPV